ncbi:zinc finger protein [Macleaya cordata]|uniref:GATA transcription factor n=1 Tax=Macleaya cordata TaxID=56857 RepID=A0A200RC11_MACCD|nr:zinc finger protein [Macleaya cordata]
MEAPEFFHGGYSSCRTLNAQFTPEKRHAATDHKLSSGGAADQFIIEDLLDFSNEDAILGDGTFDCITTGNSTDSASSVTFVDSSCNSSISGNDPNFSGDFGSRDFPDAPFSNDLCVPYDDLAELEWLSNFVEESFSSEDLQKLQLISGIQTRNKEVSQTREEFQPETNRNNPIFHPELPVPGKARSKRSRAAPNNWSSRLLVLSPTTSSSESDVASNSSKKTLKAISRKKEVSDGSTGSASGDGRKCLHCATDKTPQWRTGPMGPKTLCNACGVRYKSGRLVPEYRPAASPTFVLAKHSNSHRKVLELRRQKEMQMSQQQQFLYPNQAFDVSNGDDYLIHHHTGPDFRQLI